MNARTLSRINQEYLKAEHETLSSIVKQIDEDISGYSDDLDQSFELLTNAVGMLRVCIRDYDEIVDYRAVNTFSWTRDAGDYMITLDVPDAHSISAIENALPGSGASSIELEIVRSILSELPTMTKKITDLEEASEICWSRRASKAERLAIVSNMLTRIEAVSMPLDDSASNAEIKQRAGRWPAKIHEI